MVGRFQIDANRTPAENIALFLDHLDEDQPEFAALLRANLKLVVPLPLQAAQRYVRRAEFNRCVERALDTPVAEEPKEATPRGVANEPAAIAE